MEFSNCLTLQTSVTLGLQAWFFRCLLLQTKRHLLPYHCACNALATLQPVVQQYESTTVWKEPLQSKCSHYMKITDDFHYEWKPSCNYAIPQNLHFCGEQRWMGPKGGHCMVSPRLQLAVWHRWKVPFGTPQYTYYAFFINLTASSHSSLLGGGTWFRVLFKQLLICTAI